MQYDIPCSVQSSLLFRREINIVILTDSYEATLCAQFCKSEQILTGQSSTSGAPNQINMDVASQVLGFLKARNYYRGSGSLAVVSDHSK